mmetsp:Transcript_29790/g.53550  ORF Transcript_29790/g.53550 Transcript_29790/m.53550 type:complete len:203 (+) Transcript_29790:471-1079(+)
MEAAGHAIIHNQLQDDLPRLDQTVHNVLKGPASPGAVPGQPCRQIAVVSPQVPSDSVLSGVQGQIATREAETNGQPLQRWQWLLLAEELDGFHIHTAPFLAPEGPPVREPERVARHVLQLLLDAIGVELGIGPGLVQAFQHLLLMPRGGKRVGFSLRGCICLGFRVRLGICNSGGPGTGLPLNWFDKHQVRLRPGLPFIPRF